MKLKTLAITVVVLAVASAAVFWLNRPKARPSEDPRIGKPLVAPSAAETIAKLRISDQGKEVIVSKNADGSWIVPSYHDFPADFSKLSNLIGELTSAEIEQFVTARPEKIARLEFKDTRVELLDGSDKNIATLVLGKTAEAGGRFVKFDQEPKAYRANLNAWLDTEAKNWADAALLEVKPDDVAKVEYTPTEGGVVKAARGRKEDPFTSETAAPGQSLNSSKITSLLNSLTSLRFTETAEPNDANAVAAKQNLRVAKLTTFDGREITVSVGRKPEQKVIKAPAAKTDGTTGPAALGTISDLAKKAGTEPGSAAAEAEKPKLLEPETETIPAGPVFAFVSSSGSNAKINALMAKRAFQVGEWNFTSLPAKAEEFYEANPAPKP